MIPCYNPIQPREENVAICVSFAPLKKLSNSGGYFSGYTILYHDKYRNKNFRDGMNKTDENQDFQKHARNKLMLLQNVSARVWQNLVAFSSVVNHQDFLNKMVLYAAGGGCSRTARSGRPRPLRALMG